MSNETDTEFPVCGWWMVARGYQVAIPLEAKPSRWRIWLSERLLGWHWTPAS